MNLRDWLRQERLAGRLSALQLGEREANPGVGPQARNLPYAPTARTRRSGVPPVTVGVPPIGETIAVQRGQQWLDETGTAFSFTGFHPVLVGAGFDDAQFPLQEFVIPVTAYYRLDVKFRWQDYVGPTRVEVVLNGQVAHSESVPWADRFMGTFDCGVLRANDTVQVRGRPRA